MCIGLTAVAGRLILSLATLQECSLGGQRTSLRLLGVERSFEQRNQAINHHLVVLDNSAVLLNLLVANAGPREVLLQMGSLHSVDILRLPDDDLRRGGRQSTENALRHRAWWCRNYPRKKGSS